MKYLLILSISFLTLFSCKNPYTSDIQRIDSMLVALDSSRIQLYKIDTGLVFRRIKIIQKNLDYIYANADTVNREQAFVIDDYSNVKKYYSKGVMRFNVMFTEIETIPMQLKNLRKDLSKNIIEKEKANTYLLNEQFAAEALTISINTVQGRIVSLEDTFKESHEKILLLIQSIDSVNSTKPATVLN